MGNPRFREPTGKMLLFLESLSKSKLSKFVFSLEWENIMEHQCLGKNGKVHSAIFSHIQLVGGCKEPGHCHVTRVSNLK